MDRRRFLLTSLAGALAAPLAAEAQQAGKAHRIGVLCRIARHAHRLSLTVPLPAAARARLGRGAEYRRRVSRSAEGQRAAPDTRRGTGEPQAPTSSYATTRRRTGVPKEATRPFPIVWLDAGDPVAAGRRRRVWPGPGGNVTGVSWSSARPGRQTRASYSRKWSRSRQAGRACSRDAQLPAHGSAVHGRCTRRSRSRLKCHRLTPEDLDRRPSRDDAGAASGARRAVMSPHPQVDRRRSRRADARRSIACR